MKNIKNNGTTKDPRHFTYLYGKCPNVEDLGGNWAPSKTYGEDIVKMANQIINTKVPIDKYKMFYEKVKDLLNN